MRAQVPIGSTHQERLESAFGVATEISKARFNGRSGSSGAGFDPANCRRDESEIISGKVARDHVHVFVGYRPNQDVSQIMQWLKGISSRVLLQEFPHLRKRFWGRHFWARGYLAVSSGNITDEMVKEYIEEQEGEQIIDDSRFPWFLISQSGGSSVRGIHQKQKAISNCNFRRKVLCFQLHGTKATMASEML